MYVDWICLTTDFKRWQERRCPGLAFIGHDLMGFDPVGPHGTVQ